MTSTSTTTFPEEWSSRRGCRANTDSTDSASASYLQADTQKLYSTPKIGGLLKAILLSPVQKPSSKQHKIWKIRSQAYRKRILTCHLCLQERQWTELYQRRPFQKTLYCWGCHCFHTNFPPSVISVASNGDRLAAENILKLLNRRFNA